MAISTESLEKSQSTVIKNETENKNIEFISNDANQLLTADSNDKIKNETNENFVIHIGYIHPKANEIEIFAIAAPFGQFVKFLHLKNKNQAMIEFEKSESATRLIEYSKKHQLRIRGKDISVRYSEYNKLKTTEDRSSDLLTLYKSFHIDRAKRILHVAVRPSVYQVTLEDFETLFFRYGKVQKLVMFDRDNQTHAIIEMEDLESAIIAKVSLDEQFIFSDGDNLKVEFSKKDSVNFGRDCQNCRDYSKPLERRTPRKNDSNIYYERRQRERSPLSPLPPTSRNDSHRQYYNRAGDVEPFHLARSARESFPPINKRSPVILISNLPENKLTCDDLFNFVGCYGDIKRIKLLYNKRDSALIQMFDSFMAEQVVKYLHKVPFDGACLHVSYSNYSSISMPTDASEFSAFTKDYSNSSFRRFKTPGSKNYRHIYPPSRILHVSNISQNRNDDEIEIIDLFTKVARVKVERVEQLRNITGQVFVVTATVTDAIYAIMKLHNYILPNSCELKVAFSKGNTTTTKDS